MRKRNEIPSDDRSSDEARSSKIRTPILPHGGPDGPISEKVISSSPVVPPQVVTPDEPASLHHITPIDTKRTAFLERQDGADASQLETEPSARPRINASVTPEPIPSAAELSSAPNAPNERKLFFAFVKVLLKYLEKTNDDSLRRRAKAIIAECTLRNRNGDSDYLCLQGAIERRLQQCLGPYHWDRAQVCYHKFLERCRMPSTIEVTSSACV